MPVDGFDMITDYHLHVHPLIVTQSQVARHFSDKWRFIIARNARNAREGCLTMLSHV